MIHMVLKYYDVATDAQEWDIPHCESKQGHQPNFGGRLRIQVLNYSHYPSQAKIVLQMLQDGCESRHTQLHRRLHAGTAS